MHIFVPIVDTSGGEWRDFSKIDTLTNTSVNCIMVTSVLTSNFFKGFSLLLFVHLVFILLSLVCSRSVLVNSKVCHTE